MQVPLPHRRASNGCPPHSGDLPSSRYSPSAGRPHADTPHITGSAQGRHHDTATAERRATFVIVNGQVSHGHGQLCADVGSGPIRTAGNHMPPGSTGPAVGLRVVPWVVSGLARVGMHGFPPALPGFAGRAGEVAEVAGLLEKYRLVTVTGPSAGSGGGGRPRGAAHEPTGWPVRRSPQRPRSTP